MNKFKMILMGLLALSAFAGEAIPTRQQRIDQTVKTLQKQLDDFGGMDGIEKKLETFRAEVKQKVTDSDERYPEVNGTHFQNGITRGSLQQHWPIDTPEGSEGLSGYDAVVELNNKLQKLGVDLIMVPVPSKFELYSHHFETKTPEGLPLNPARIEMMLELSKAGVEVVDVLPMLEHELPNAKHPLYEVKGHHLSSLGALHAGDFLAERLERYHLANRDKSRYGFNERKSVERASTLPMTAFEVTRDGEPYKHVSDGEVIVIGDSQAFAHFGAGWASHIARAAGADITDLSLSSMANWMPQRLGHLGAERLAKTKAVIYIVTSSSFVRFGWKHTEIPDKATVPGLLSLGMFDEVNKLVDNFEGNPTELGIDEDYINNTAYRMAATSNFEEAEAAFKLNTRFYPKSANAWDSLAEFLARRDRAEEAEAAARKALSLSPSDNVVKNALQTLRRLGVDTSQWEDTSRFVTLNSKQMDALVGEYHLTQDTQVTIKHEEDQLVLYVKDGPRIRMLPLSPTSFETDQGPKLTFTEQGDDLLLEANLGREIRTGKRVSSDESSE